MLKSSIKRTVFLAATLILFSGCLSYYQKNLQLMQAFENERFEEAEVLVNNKKLAKKKRNILLYYLNKATVLHMLGKYKESNEYFQKADYYIEDYHTNYSLKALSLVTNPSIEPYSGENFEKILLHYYSTLNYIQLNELDEALVECKRMLIMMQNITTYYKKNNKYNRDALTHLLLGIIYDAKQDPMNAFIAYRNAYEVYRDDYQKLLGTSIPMQLKKDLLRTAAQNGYRSELTSYEKEFGFKYEKNDSTKSSLVYFWNNGVCPVKAENSVNFLITNMGNGYVLFSNLELGISFPFYVGNDKEKMNGLIKMKLFRVAFPKYVSREPSFQTAFIKTETEKYNLETAEDINAIAHRSLKDRMVKEWGETLLRMALKKLSEMQVNQNNKDLGLALNILNNITEKADTRNWQMLPYTINYTRVGLIEGVNKLTLHTSGNNGLNNIDSLSIDARPYQTYVQSSWSFLQ